MNADDEYQPPNEEIPLDDSVPPELPHSPPPKRKLTTWQKILASKFLLVSIGVHLLFGAGAAVYVVQQNMTKRVPTFKGGPGAVNPSSRALEHKVSMDKKKNTMSAPMQSKRITVNNPLAKIALPEMVTMANANQVIPNKMGGQGGTGNSLFGGQGNGGLGGGGNGFGLPTIMNDRCSVVTRATSMRNNGGSPQCEEAIIKGLRWLKTQQNADGSFGQQFSVGMTGLALLSFMGHCERPSSKEFGPCVRKAIDFLVTTAGSGATISRGGGNSTSYEHGIATYALGEAYILTKEQKIAEVLKKAVYTIVQGQSPDGGWSYGYSKGAGDTSVSGWQVQALKAAKLSGLNIDGVDSALKKAVDGVLRVRGPQGGFGYTSPGDRWALTAVGILVLQTTHHEGGRGQTVRKALDFLIDRKDAPKLDYDAADADLYGWYYGTQACFQHGGSAWTKWNRQFQPELLKAQNEDGSWKPTRGGSGDIQSGGASSPDGQIFRNSCCILMLEVYYRYLASSRI
ncbi:MAG: terpene cyclase/mutase family protein [Chthoniobacter sp.]|nr:terpene cyclase/mutase family protein [Chthoniobacter sp.]